MPSNSEGPAEATAVRAERDGANRPAPAPAGAACAPRFDAHLAARGKGASSIGRRDLAALVIPLIVFGVFFGWAQAAHWDLATLRHLFDPVRGSFPARHAWWAEELVHRRGRDLVAVIALLALATFASSFFGAATPTRRDRRRSAGYVVLCLLLGTGLVAGLKRVTHVDCPWDLELFGGSRPYVGLFGERPEDLPPGHCFPGGHSSGAFALFGLYFVLKERNRRAARAVLVGVLVLGAVFSFGQWARGAHFPTHDATSAILCWAMAWTLFHLAFKGRLQGSAERPESGAGGDGPGLRGPYARGLGT